MAHFTMKLILHYCPSFIQVRENQPRAHSWVVEYGSFSVGDPWVLVLAGSANNILAGTFMLFCAMWVLPVSY